MTQDRIQELSRKLALLKSLDPGMSVFGSEDHQYISVKISGAEADELRASNWPEEYIEFLSTVGSGAGPYYGILSYRESLSQAEGAWLLDTPMDDKQVGNEKLTERMIAAGATRNTLVPICDSGCGEYFRLATDGPRKGLLWYDRGFGDNSIRPLECSFLEFYESWLDGALKQWGALAQGGR